MAGVDQAGDCLKPLPPAAGGEGLSRDAPLEVERTEWWYHRDRPAAFAHRTHCLVLGLATHAIEKQVDTVGDCGQDLLDPVGGVVVEDFAGAQVPQVVMVGRAGHAHGASAYGRRDLHGGAAHASGGGRDEHGVAGS
jgi:hypothetical protein